MPFLRGTSWPGFLYCLKYAGSGTDQLLYDIRKKYSEQTAPYAFKSLSLYFDFIQWSVCALLLQDELMKEQTHLICMRICIAYTILCRSHLLTLHDWSIMYNACTLLVKLLFDHYLQQVSKQENKAKYRNPGQDVSLKNGTNDHPSYNTPW